jgi:hypothetical protein
MKEERYSGDAWVRIWKEKGETKEEMENRLSEALTQLEIEHGIKVLVDMNDKPDL